MASNVHNLKDFLLYHHITKNMSCCDTNFFNMSYYLYHTID